MTAILLYTCTDNRDFGPTTPTPTTSPARRIALAHRASPLLTTVSVARAMLDAMPTTGRLAQLPAEALAAAEVFVEAADRPIAGGRWHIVPGEVVWYERPSGEFNRAVIAAHTLRSSPTWRPLAGPRQQPAARDVDRRTGRPSSTS